MSEENKYDSGGKLTDVLSTKSSSSEQTENNNSDNNTSQKAENKNTHENSALNYLKDRMSNQVQKNNPLKDKINQGKQAIETLKKTYHIGSLTFKGIFGTLSFLFGTPSGWVILGIIVLMYSILIAQPVFGPSQFGSVCLSNNAPDVSVLNNADKTSVTAGFIAGDSRLSKSTGAYISHILQERKFNFNRATGVPANCDNDCLLETIKNSTDLNNMKVGVMDWSHEDIGKLIQLAKDDNMQWYDSAVQLKMIKNQLSLVSAANAKSSVGGNKNSEKIVKDINTLFGIQASKSQVKNSSKRVKLTYKSVSTDAQSCVPMGNGCGKGRVDGGEAKSDRKECKEKARGSNANKVKGKTIKGKAGAIGGGKIDVLEEKLGQPVDMDGYYGAQCWDLTNFYLQSLGSRGIAGQSGRAGYIGHEFKAQLEAEGFEVILDPDPSMLQAGDVVNIYPFTAHAPSQWGHTGIVAENKGGGSVITYEQNAEQGQINAKYERHYAPGEIASIIRKKK